MRMKKGRLRRVLSIDSVWISVVTHRDRQFFVTNSSKVSAVWNVYDEEVSEAFDVPFGRDELDCDSDKSCKASPVSSMSPSSCLRWTCLKL